MSGHVACHTGYTGQDLHLPCVTLPETRSPRQELLEGHLGEAAGWEGDLAGPLLGICSSAGLTPTIPVHMTWGVKTGSQVRKGSAQA